MGLAPDPATPLADLASTYTADSRASNIVASHSLHPSTGTASPSVPGSARRSRAYLEVPQARLLLQGGQAYRALAGARLKIKYPYLRKTRPHHTGVYVQRRQPPTWAAGIAELATIVLCTEDPISTYVLKDRLVRGPSFLPRPLPSPFYTNRFCIPSTLSSFVTHRVMPTGFKTSSGMIRATHS
jgi:hypothetical protein